MASDEELSKHIQAYERGDEPDATELRARVRQLESATRDANAALAERIERRERDGVTHDDLIGVLERLDAIESRLDDLEAELP
ncbi:hypothetical protein [Natronomonas sp. EA1]|uniref:hypothetical protein n=1 Tax=Natronomonas sp. EA1 TaxID=3421655 RepID=UPI003EBAAF99